MPMDLKKYPPNWRKFSKWVRTERAHDRCECLGECGVYHHGGQCGAPNGERVWRADDSPGRWFEDVEDLEANAVGGPFRQVKIVLTVAHLWRGACADCHAAGLKCDNPEHVKALCQACHLRYDLEHHIANRARNRRNARAAGDLFDGPNRLK